ncbi:MAG: hypothetical protein IIA77_01575 [Proteobacteria bacterium]|nr:hypothetical protein [Pseudomonadota bacterium]
MSKTDDIQTLLKTMELPIREYVAALEKENLKLHIQIAKLQADDVSSKNRITALMEQVKKLGGTPEKITKIERVIHKPKS